MTARTHGPKKGAYSRDAIHGISVVVIGQTNAVGPGFLLTSDPLGPGVRRLASGAAPSGVGGQ